VGQTIEVRLDGDGAWPDLAQMPEANKIYMEDSTLSIACLKNGMTSGRPSLVMRINLPDGRVLIFQTSMRGFLSAASIVATGYPPEKT
jgi:hypothetical protein